MHRLLTQSIAIDSMPHTDLTILRTMVIASKTEKAEVSIIKYQYSVFMYHF